MNYIAINSETLHLVKLFFTANKSPHFRYYDKRTIDEAIVNQKYTVIMENSGELIGYGHIDYENRNWLGIFISSSHQNRGYGKLLMDHLIKTARELPISDLYLTVDKANHAGIRLYRKYGFVALEETDTFYKMRLSFDIVSLPVSYGEAFDKLSILDIKLSKIKDERAKDVLIEYNMIKDKLNNIMTPNVEYYYKILKNINQVIWDKQDIFRETTDIDLKNRLCVEIIDDNDRRFRVKYKINSMLNSVLKEQKGYTKKRALLATPQATINNTGMIRYYATVYDELILECNEGDMNYIRNLYCDDCTIKVCMDDSIPPAIRNTHVTITPAMQQSDEHMFKDYA